MCTVTFIARRRGYYLAMNRDEKLARPAGFPPKKKMVNGRAVIFPSDPGGGTWIALNDQGATLALINWYSITARIDRNALSRGEVVNSTSAASSSDSADATLLALPLNRINPFRLVAVFPATSEIVEWRWNLKQLVRMNHRWKIQQWISSGFDEPAAQRVRGTIFRLAQKQETSESLGWLRRLHGSHLPEVGPCSTCMHRDDAATVSYTEISVSRFGGTMRYHPGAPCRELENSCVQGLDFSRRIRGGSAQAETAQKLDRSVGGVGEMCGCPPF
jgi:transport and Golgi organization protein 2